MKNERDMIKNTSDVRIVLRMRARLMCGEIDGHSCYASVVFLACFIMVPGFRRRRLSFFLFFGLCSDSTGIHVTQVDSIFVGAAPNRVLAMVKQAGVENNKARS